MLDTWNESIFSNIKSRLQDSAMKLVHAERQGEAFDSQLVIGVRESYGKTCRETKVIIHLFCRFSLKIQKNSLIEEHILCLSLFTVNLCSNPEDKLQIYRDNFEKAYLDSTERFYRTQAPSYLQQNGVQNYMKYVSSIHFIIVRPYERVILKLVLIFSFVQSFPPKLIINMCV